VVVEELTSSLKVSPDNPPSSSFNKECPHKHSKAHPHKDPLRCINPSPDMLPAALHEVEAETVECPESTTIVLVAAEVDTSRTETGIKPRVSLMGSGIMVGTTMEAGIAVAVEVE